MTVINKCKDLTLKSIRKKLGISQSELAKKLGVRRETISDWERGKHSPSLSIPQFKTLSLLLQEAGIKLDDLPDDLSTR